MIVHHHKVDGEPVEVHVVEHEDDLEGFRDFIRANINFLGLDSETTGLDIYGSSFRCRLVQFGNARESWVVPVELGGRFEGDVCVALRSVQGFVLQNASYDLQVFEQTLGIPMEEMWPKVTDTKILAHLVDPLGQKDGGIGHSLEALTRRYVDEYVADNVKTLMKDLAAEHHTTKANVWKKVPLTDPNYQLYSGMDPILAARLMQKLIPLVPQSSSSLVAYEHKLAEICAYMERTGLLLDVDYATDLAGKLRYEETLQNKTAQDFGCENLNSTEQVADVLEQYGYQVKGRTASGKRQVNEAVLNEVAAGEYGQATRFATAIIEGKRAGKWRKTWVQKFLDEADSGNRCHASINPLQARTARMSITGIPAQTLPAGDSMVRRCFLADPGHLIASVDYQAQELRVLAALSRDPTMIEAFRNGMDLHQITADAADVVRDVGKMSNFLTVFGGGPAKLALQADIPFPVAKRVMDAFAETYPGVTKYSAKLQREASRDGYITTGVGRRLTVDPTRAYASLNYDIQSSARDVTGRALIRLHEAGLTEYMRIPLHDEILCSLPEAEAPIIAAEIAEIMEEQAGAVRITTEAQVGGRSWGSLYFDPEKHGPTDDPYLTRRT